MKAVGLIVDKADKAGAFLAQYGQGIEADDVRQAITRCLRDF